MNSMLLLEAVGQLDEDLLERSENASGKKNTVRRVIQWTALAACLCIVFTWGSQFLSLGSKTADHSNGENAPMESPLEDKPLEIPSDLENGDVSVHFEVSYVRIDGEVGTASQISVINSCDELNVNTEETVFMTATQKYNAAFFEEKQLIILMLEEKDKGMVPKVAQIVRDPQQETVVINVHWEPSRKAEETACWQICIEVQKGLAKPEMIKLRHHVIVEEPAG